MNGYKKIRMFGSDVHIFEYNQRKKISRIEQGITRKLEPLSKLGIPRLGEKIEAKVNLTFFDPPSKTEILGNDYPNWTQVGFCADTVLRFYDPKKVGDLAPWEKDAIWSVPLSYTLLENGKISIRNITYFKDHYNNPNPRTIIAQRANLNMVLIVVQGRRLMNRGMTAMEEAELCQELGLYMAVNADGGGSSEMIVVENGKQIIKNKPTDGHERPIGTGLVIYGK